MNLYARLICLFLVTGCGVNAHEFSSKNIPQSRDDAPHTIRFCTTRNVLTDGALKSELLEQLKNQFEIDAFVESGTYLGATTANAAKIFREVHTVELSEKFALQAKERFKQQKNVVVYQGDSGQVFRTILPKITDRILFYLDGHYSGGETAQGAENTPMMQELQAIRDAKKADAIILVDDIRCFQDSVYPDKIRNTILDGYPTLQQLVSALLEINAEYQICFLGDALLAFPRNPNISISPVVSACTVHRFASVFPNFSENELKKADLAIKNIQDVERDEMVTYQKAYASFEMENGLRSFGTFWVGLMYAGQGKEKEALVLYKKAKENSKPGWRAHQIEAVSRGL